MRIIRQKLDGGTVFPKKVRYNDVTDKVEVTYDDGETWVEDEFLDPRVSPALRRNTAPRPTQCDTAANVRAFLQSNIQGVLDVFEEFGTAAGIVGALVSLLLTAFLSLGPFGVIVTLFFALATYMVSLGGSAIEYAFINGEWDTVLCNVLEYTPEDGDYTQEMLDGIVGLNTATLNTAAAGIVNGMLLLMGFVGLTNAGKTGENTADCTDCVDEVCQKVNDFLVSPCDFSLTGAQGVWELGVGWRTTSNGVNQQLFAQRICEGEEPAAAVEITFVAYRYNNFQVTCYDAANAVVLTYNQNRNAGTHTGTFNTGGTRKIKKIVLYSGVSGTSPAGAFQEINLIPF